MNWEDINDALTRLIDQPGDSFDSDALYADCLELLGITEADPLLYFAYGSQIWAPSFNLGRRMAGAVEGYRRDYCIYSFIYRGTEEAPGLVLGLREDHASSVQGMVYEIAAAELKTIFRQEMKNAAYLPRWVSVSLAEGEACEALSFIARPEHSQFADLSLTEQAQTIITGSGQRGSSLDYFVNTNEALKQLDVQSTSFRALELEIQRLLSQRAG